MFKKVYVEITNVCNLKCKFCPETDRVKEFMSIENFEKVISKIHNYTKTVCLHVKGEPLLHKDLDRILETLKNYGLKANITTNGTLIKEKLKTIKESNAVMQINFSLHSVSQNESLGSEYLRDIFESADELKDVMISYRLWNLKSFKENDINADIIKFAEEYYNMPDLRQKLTQNDFVRLNEHIFINQDTEFTWPDINKERINERGRCLALKDQIAILVDGTVVPCCLDNNGDIPLGNIFNEELADILKKPFAAEVKKNFENGIITCKLCKTCGFLKRLEDKQRRDI